MVSAVASALVLGGSLDGFVGILDVGNNMLRAELKSFENIRYVLKGSIFSGEEPFWVVENNF